MTHAITYEAIVARVETCLGIARDRAAVADYERAAKFTHYSEALIDALEIDLRARGETWDIGESETLEDRLGRVRAVLAEPATEDAAAKMERVNASVALPENRSPSRRT